MRTRQMRLVLTIAVLLTFLKVLIREEGTVGEKIAYILRAVVGEQVDQRSYYTHDGTQPLYAAQRYAPAF